MKITLQQMLPSNDLFSVEKENNVLRFKFERWNHGHWLPPLKPGDKIVSEGIADLRIKGEPLYSFVGVDPETKQKNNIYFGIKKSDLEMMLEDGTLDYHSQYVYMLEEE